MWVAHSGPDDYAKIILPCLYVLNHLKHTWRMSALLGSAPFLAETSNLG